MGVTEIGFLDVDWIHVAQDRNQLRAVANTAMVVGFQKGGEFLDLFLKKDCAPWSWLFYRKMFSVWPLMSAINNTVDPCL
jgi:hypothetical protein